MCIDYLRNSAYWNDLNEWNGFCLRVECEDKAAAYARMKYKKLSIYW
jgi:hypothetical protein